MLVCIAGCNCINRNKFNKEQGCVGQVGIEGRHKTIDHNKNISTSLAKQLLSYQCPGRLMRAWARRSHVGHDAGFRVWSLMC